MASARGFGRRRFRLKKKVVLPVLAVLVVGFFIGLVYVLRNWQGTVVVSDETTTGPTAGSPVDSSEIMEREGLVVPMSQEDRRILNRHFAAVGGVNLFISMSSFRISGDLTFPDGQVHEAILMRKGQVFERITIRSPEHLQVSVISPDDKWVAYWKSGELLKVEDLGAADSLEMERNAPVVNELYVALQSGSIMQYLGQRDFNYKMSHVFEVQSGQRNSTRFYIDPETFLNSGREDRIFAPDGTLTITRRIYSDHMDAKGLTIPGKVQTIINEVPSRTFHVHQAELNVGLLDSVFQRPEMSVKP